MAEKKGSVIIIKKKKGGGHAAAHGGAWKVAYADFVTAMMCFFLVMWLMGSDEVTKAEITHYFNHPNTPWKFGGDPESKMARPLGEKPGSGETILSGLGGASPDDLVPNPSRPINDKQQSNSELNDRPHPDTEDQISAVEMEIDQMRFSFSDANLFKPGTTEFAPGAQKYLERIHQLVAGFSGVVQINGYTPTYELSTAKAVAVMKHMVDKRWITEERVKPRGLASSAVGDEDSQRARVEFVLSKKK
jgi:chemotaxis protein MotB